MVHVQKTNQRMNWEGSTFQRMKGFWQRRLWKPSWSGETPVIISIPPCDLDLHPEPTPHILLNSLNSINFLSLMLVINYCMPTHALICHPFTIPASSLATSFLTCQCLQTFVSHYGFIVLYTDDKNLCGYRMYSKQVSIDSAIHLRISLTFLNNVVVCVYDVTHT